MNIFASPLVLPDIQSLLAALRAESVIPVTPGEVLEKNQAMASPQQKVTPGLKPGFRLLLDGMLLSGEPGEPAVEQDPKTEDEKPDNPLPAGTNTPSQQLQALPLRIEIPVIVPATEEAPGPDGGPPIRAVEVQEAPSLPTRETSLHAMAMAPVLPDGNAVLSQTEAVVPEDMADVQLAKPDATTVPANAESPSRAQLAFAARITEHPESLAPSGGPALPAISEAAHRATVEPDTPAPFRGPAALSPVPETPAESRVTPAVVLEQSSARAENTPASAPGVPAPERATTPEAERPLKAESAELESKTPSRQEARETSVRSHSEQPHAKTESAQHSSTAEGTPSYAAGTRPEAVPAAPHVAPKVADSSPPAKALEARHAESAPPPEPDKTFAASRGSEPARDISLQISGADRERVDVRVAERAGEVRVSVRTADPALAGALRDNLSDLVNRLDRGGLHTETWQPASAGSASTDNRHGERGSDGRASYGSPHGRSQQGASDGQQRRQQDQPRPQWAEEIEKTERSPFAWLHPGTR